MRYFTFGTDWYTDVDDVMAGRILSRFHNSGQITLMGVAVNAVMPHSVPSVDAFFTHEGLPNLPIGIDLNSEACTGREMYQPRLAALPGAWRTNTQVPAAVRIYRQALAAAPAPVDMVEVGFLQVLGELLDTQPDEYSPLNGADLLRMKCRKLWCMGGTWPKGLEYNTSNTKQTREAFAKICKRWPSPITFLGFEVGETVICGGLLPEEDAVKRALNDHGSPTGRSAWDPLTALLACIGDEAAAGYETVRGYASNDPVTGENFFTSDPNGRHAYVVKTHPDEWYQAQTDAVLLAAPT
ncbi:MAG: hypothetical protein LBR73_00045 [Oscillospiraceae bacterium]|jgi:hypothetical protein|nr:hypothetical protein [Oscillospiraceae bacterium]